MELKFHIIQNISIHKYIQFKLLPLLLFPLFHDCCWMFFSQVIFPPPSFCFQPVFGQYISINLRAKITFIFKRFSSMTNVMTITSLSLEFLFPALNSSQCLGSWTGTCVSLPMLWPNTQNFLNSLQFPLHSKTVVVLTCLVFSFHPIVLCDTQFLLWVLIRSRNLISSANDFSLAHLLVALNIWSKGKHSEPFLQSFVLFTLGCSILFSLHYCLTLNWYFPGNIKLSEVQTAFSSSRVLNLHSSSFFLDFCKRGGFICAVSAKMEGCWSFLILFYIMDWGTILKRQLCEATVFKT